MRQRIGVLIVGIDAVTQANREQIAQALIKRRLPSMSREREFVEAGGLMSYGVHYPDLYRRDGVGDRGRPRVLLHGRGLAVKKAREGRQRLG